MNLTTARRALDPILADLAHATRTEADERIAQTRAQEQLHNAHAAQELIQAAAQATQEAAHAKLASVVSRCLKAVFGPDAYEFCVRFDRTRGRTSARLVFVGDGQEMDPLSTCGGGVADVTAFALRLACLLLSIPRKRRLLVLDEPFRHLSRGYSAKVSVLLEMLAKEMDVQILMVTHNRRLKAGKVIDLSEVEG